jgi:penicillin-binding protein 1A
VTTRTVKKKVAPRKRKKPLKEKQIIVFLFSVCALLSLFLGVLLFGLDQLKIPDIRNVSNYQPSQTTLIFDRDGTVIDRLYKENRIVVPLDKMHPLIPKAFVAAEDGRFYEHPGLDFFSVLRALINNFRDGKKSQGGSTITQQVAKGLLLTPEKTYLRKFKEAILAWRIDTLLSKDEIIYIYLNHIYLGEGAYGIEAAALTYFAKHATELSLAEIALLAGLPQAPSRYSPRDHWERAHTRQRYVLNRMAADGYITGRQAKAAYGVKSVIVKSATDDTGENGYYLLEVRKRAEQMLGRSLESAGVRIHTNLDQKMQLEAQKAIRRGVKKVLVRNQRQAGNKKAPEGALITLDACSGQVRALVGGTDFRRTPFNRAVQARRPAGSVFKPLVYSAALENGWTAKSMIVDEPVSITGSDGQPWRPKNFSGKYHGKVSLETALINSYNIPAIKVMQRIGIKPVHELARRSGISADMPPDLSLALGAVDVSLLEMSAAYEPYICDGKYVQPTMISRITDRNGAPLHRFEPEQTTIMSRKNAIQMRSILERVITDGTGRKAQGMPGLAGGKTGTSDENRDAWFIGFHRQYITGVWVGHDRNESLGQYENGGRTAAPIWLDYQKSVIGQ